MTSDAVAIQPASPASPIPRTIFDQRFNSRVSRARDPPLPDLGGQLWSELPLDLSPARLAPRARRRRIRGQGGEGAAQGIGRAISLFFANAGYAVSVADTDVAAGRELVRMIEAAGGRALDRKSTV